MTDKLKDGEHTLNDGTVINVSGGIASVAPEPAEKPLYHPGTKIDPRAKPNTVHAGLTKFSQGQEVETPGGFVGHILEVKDGGIYTVTFPSSQDFSEDDLKEVIPLDAE